MRGRQCFVIRISSFFRILAFGFRIFRRVRQFHHVVEVTVPIVAPDLEDIDHAFVRARDRLELLDAGILSFVGALVLETVAIDDFDGAIRANHVARQPDLAIAAEANQAQQFVIGNLWRWMGLRCLGWRAAQWCQG